MINELLTRLHFLLSRARVGDLDAELQFHIEQSVQAKIADGITHEEARRRALIEFGGFERTRELREDRVCEEIAYDDIHAQTLPETRNDPHSEKRMTTENEKVVVSADTIQVKQLGPDLRQELFDFALGRLVAA